MSSKKQKKPSLGERFIRWFSGADKKPSTADCVAAVANVEWSLLQLKLAIKKGDYLVAKRLRYLENFGKPWYKKRYF